MAEVKKSWFVRHKILTVLLGLIVLGIIGSVLPEQQRTSTNQDNAQVNSQTNEQSDAAPEVPQYELVGEFGQGGKVYVIDPADANEERLTLIGKDLNKRFGSDTFARISIFTDRKQATILADDPGSVLDLEGAAADSYELAFVAQFNINQTTDYKEFIIFPATVAKTKVIEL